MLSLVEWLSIVILHFVSNKVSIARMAYIKNNNHGIEMSEQGDYTDIKKVYEDAGL